MCGGDQADYDRAQPVLNVYAKMCALIGGPGSGQLTKMVNQVAIVGLLQGLSEALNFGKKAGLDMEKVIAVISKGAAQSWQLENRWKTMVEGKFEGFGFASDWMRKDLNIALAEAKKNGSHMPGTALIEQYYGRISAGGHGRWDNTSLMSLLAKD
jgi:3-hydroxyisobutyrate dehydrogenase-like beta-hydroxyacid dehydrogenase